MSNLNRNQLAEESNNKDFRDTYPEDWPEGNKSSNQEHIGKHGLSVVRVMRIM